jgi:hypothetical protein
LQVANLPRLLQDGGQPGGGGQLISAGEAG